MTPLIHCGVLLFPKTLVLHSFPAIYPQLAAAATLTPPSSMVAAPVHHLGVAIASPSNVIETPPPYTHALADIDVASHAPLAKLADAMRQGETQLQQQQQQESSLREQQLQQQQKVQIEQQRVRVQERPGLRVVSRAKRLLLSTVCSTTGRDLVRTLLSEQQQQQQQLQRKLRIEDALRLQLHKSMLDADAVCRAALDELQAQQTQAHAEMESITGKFNRLLCASLCSF